MALATWPRHITRSAPSQSSVYPERLMTPPSRSPPCWSRDLVAALPPGPGERTWRFPVAPIPRTPARRQRRSDRLQSRRSRTSGTSDWRCPGRTIVRARRRTPRLRAFRSLRRTRDRPGPGSWRQPRFAFFALRASRYALIFALGTFLCLAQTMPNTGAARPRQFGTGHSWIGPLRRGFFAAFGAFLPFGSNAASRRRPASMAMAVSMSLVNFATSFWMSVMGSLLVLGSLDYVR